jgi:hypothetical protein
MKSIGSWFLKKFAGQKFGADSFQLLNKINGFQFMKEIS